MPNLASPSRHVKHRCLPAVLGPLKRLPRWVIWRTKIRNGKPSKPPYCAKDPQQPAETDNPSTWCEYAVAMRAVRHGEADGVGFVLGAGIWAIDLDRCFDSSTLHVTRAWALEMLADAGSSYCEITPSGTGLRIIGFADGDELQESVFRQPEGGKYELYLHTNRYITITGYQITVDDRECERLTDISKLIRKWHRRGVAQRRQSIAHREGVHPVGRVNGRTRAELLAGLPGDLRSTIELDEITVQRLFDRSRHLYTRIYPRLVKAGLNIEQIITVLESSAFNKFAGLRGGHTLRVDVTKYFNKEVWR